jgi:uncharacterized protein (TIGR00251 family)
MSLASCLRAQNDVVYLSIKVQARASRNEIGEVIGSELKIKITAPPVNSAANEALVRFLSEALDCASGAVQIVRGEKSRHKVVAIRGLTAAEIEIRLERQGL